MTFEFLYIYNLHGFPTLTKDDEGRLRYQPLLSM